MLVKRFLAGLEKLFSATDNWTFLEPLVLSIEHCAKCQTCADACHIFVESGRNELYRPTFRSEILRRLYFKLPPSGSATCCRWTPGFPTDDPWGDRHESLPLDAFDALVENGITFARPPRTGYEYSNLGYALLGRVVAVASGTDYRDLVRAELLDPLGMTATRYDADATSLPTGWSRATRPPTPASSRSRSPVPGAFSPMGGLHSSVRDLAHLGRGVPGGVDTATRTHPLDRWSRREMQEQHSYIAAATTPATDDVPERVVVGLVRLRPRRRGRRAARPRRVALRRLPGLRLAHAVAPRERLGRRRARQPHLLPGLSGSAARVLASIVEQHRAEHPADALATRVAAHPRGDGRDRVAASSRGTTRSPTAGSRPTSTSTVPRAERRAAVEGVRSRIGAFTPGGAPRSCRPRRRRRAGGSTAPRATAYAEVLLTPDREPLIQSLTVSTDPVPDTSGTDRRTRGPRRWPVRRGAGRMGP